MAEDNISSLKKSIKYKPVEPLNLGVGGDRLSDFGRKYNHEVSHIYDILNVLGGMETLDTVDVDTELSDTSTNVVENKAITNALALLVQGVDDTTGKLWESVNKKSPLGHTHTVGEITDIPDVLTKDNISAWALQKTKPDYCWCEIKCRPEIVTDIRYNGKLIPNINGLVDIDLVDIYDLGTIYPTKDEVTETIESMHSAITDDEIDEICD